MIDTEFNKAIDIIDKLNFFYGQRAGRELWCEKPVDIQNEDIKNFVRDLEFLKTFLKEQKAALTDVLEYLESIPELAKEYKPKGKWIIDSIEQTDINNGWAHKSYVTTYTCSICGSSIVGLTNMNYCPYCGSGR